MRLVSVCFFLMRILANGQTGTFEGQPAITLSNGTLSLTVMVQGATLANLVLSDDPEKLSPLWNPMRMGRELGHAVSYNGGAGHFICVDGFGAMSAEERAAGLPFHGEAHTETFQVRTGREGSASTVTMSATLPIVQEVLTRTFKMVDGENVIYVDTELESLLGFDRPVNWAEHATVGSPFLEPGVTVVDLSGSRSQTRPYEKVDNGPTQRRLTSGQNFTWPLAPGLDGKQIDLRETPEKPHFLDHATTVLDESRKVEWVTALNPKKRLVIGYLFKREEYPWLQYWGNYPPTGKLARGLEFSTQPYDVPRREVISMGRMFDTPTYRWLPAKSKIHSSFMLFFARVPDGMTKIDDAKIENGQVIVEDHASGKRIALKAASAIQ